MDNLEGLVGQTLGQYTIIEKIGEGGMAAVFKAFQPSLNRDVALKILPPTFAKQGDFSERFDREAKAIGNLHHPNILPVYDSGQDKGYSYLAMRYVEDAGTLADLMKNQLKTERIIELIKQLAGALDHAHEQGIIHRDVKPSNVLMDNKWPLLSDFGLAKMTENAVDLTGTGVGIGTPAYMSPEQGMGKKVDHRTDVYALGIILFEMLTRIVPHRAETPIATVMKRVNEPLPMPRSLNPNIPEAVERVLLKALAANPEHRFQSCGELAEALQEAFGANAAEVLPEVSPDYANPASAAAQPTAVDPPPAKTTTGGGGRSLPLNMFGFAAIGGLILLVLCGIGALILFQLRPERSPITWEFVLDVSEEMDEPFPGEDVTKWEAAQEALIDNLDTVPDRINVGLRIFGQGEGEAACSETELLVEPDPGQVDLILEEIDALEPTGLESPLSEALVEAFGDLELSPDKRNALIVLTDGADSCDPEGAADVAAFMERLNIRIDTYIIGLNIDDPDAEENLRVLASASDGVFLRANSSDELRDVIDQIRENLRAERPPRDIAQAPTPTPSPTPEPAAPDPTDTPVPAPTEVVAQALSIEDAYEITLEEALAWQEDAVLSTISTSFLDLMDEEGTSTSWTTSFYSPSAGAMTTYIFVDGQLQPATPVDLPTQPNLVPFDDSIILDGQRLFEIAAAAGGEAVMAEGYEPAA
ncbi:MAG: protein kinase, partial [Anaerolineae bacterium]|nr:protein kinase [Anaerolineae bacterium]